ncbi:MAG: histidine kinase [Bacteroidetes bacterium]|nr:histidine kinase [Bacteroidota bacterium]
MVYARNAGKLLPAVKNIDEKKFLLYTLSKRYLWYYEKTRNTGSLDTSKLYGFDLLKLAQQTNDTKTLARAYNNLQEVEYESGSYAKALLLLDSAVKYTAPDNNYDLRIIYFDKAEVLLNLKQYDAAIVCANKTLELDDSVGNKADKSDTYFLLSQILQAKGDYKKAFEYNELARKITDSIFSVQRTANVAELEKKYSQQKNETTIQELEKKKQLYLLLSISGLLSLIVIALFFRQQSLKNKKNVLETEQRLNRARMNPHFFFNSLMALQKFALKEKNNMVLASNLSKYSKLMRATLESTYKEYTTIEDEVEFLEEYFQVQQVRFEKPFAYEIKVAEDIEVDELQIPSMIIQPFVENTLEHGFVNVQDAGKIVIHFYKTNNSLNIEIIDNGAGIYGNKNNNEHISRATQIIKDRIYLLNLKHQSNASFSVNNNDKGVGVIVKINLPLLYKGTS